ncbi:serine/threonine protein kinase [Rippkaea orientalis PCC 8801]|uniref:Serine/threonine protein kinase n=1 Tax=Rippkaea orientalis (strain PCC 8801 / RF-1) TaxID=41431 RepID=B7JZ37_RIPO1|nr:serine/threonine-protein kinase [Rippkaea orientalis]ACK66114.1 serine/threonine protein kinase [Rippkaea orientalis PCC 8801]
MSNFPDFSGYNYQVIAELGRNREGGRITYLAQTIDTSQPVVLKQFRFLQGDATWQGFKVYEREISILKELNHPRIPRYLDSFETPDGFCMVQEYKNAPSLANKSRWKLSDIQEIARSILAILVDLQAHNPPIIHRDIKPENILVDDDKNVYLIDFGLARKTDTEVALSSVIAGTPGFMPPEELFNHPLTEASDLYSLGVTIISLLTHTPSVEISRLMDNNFRFNLQPLQKSINPRFRNWLETMVDPNRDYRFANAKDALFALEPIDITDLEEQSFGLAFRVSKPLVLLGLLGLGAGILSLTYRRAQVENPVVAPAAVNMMTSSAQVWYQTIKPHCNAVEVSTKLRSNPPPQTPEGIAYSAGCYALAGKTEQADQLIQQLPPEQRSQAAGVVFEIGHPVADQGDDESAGPIMELVVKYQPENFMALYHAGMSQYVLQEFGQAKKNLAQFLQIYHNNDSWRQNAITVLNRLENQ